MKRIQFIIFWGLFANGVSAQSLIDFSSEFIDFKIDQRSFTINGLYTFINKTSNNMSFPIAFPFAVETDLVDSIRLYDVTQLKEMSFEKLNKGISFKVFLLAHDTTFINIFYRQPLEEENTYILTTTKYWGKPIEKAKYSLTTNFDINIVSFSINPDSMKIENNQKTYFWEKNNFTPKVDFDVIITK